MREVCATLCQHIAQSQTIFALHNHENSDLMIQKYEEEKMWHTVTELRKKDFVKPVSCDDPTNLYGSWMSLTMFAGYDQYITVILSKPLCVLRMSNLTYLISKEPASLTWVPKKPVGSLVFHYLVPVLSHCNSCKYMSPKPCLPSCCIFTQYWETAVLAGMNKIHYFSKKKGHFISDPGWDGGWYTSKGFVCVDYFFVKSDLRLKPSSLYITFSWIQI